MPAGLISAEKGILKLVRIEANNIITFYKHLLLSVFLIAQFAGVVYSSDAEDWEIKYRPVTQETIMIPPDLKAGEEFILSLHKEKSLGNLSLEQWFQKEVTEQESDLGTITKHYKTTVLREKGLTLFYTFRAYKDGFGEKRYSFYSAMNIEKGKNTSPIVQLVSADMTNDLAIMKRYFEYILYTAKPKNLKIDPRSVIPKNISIPLIYKRISSRFGYRYDPFNKRKKMHSGIDFAAPRGTVVRSIKAGKVVFAGRRGGYGNVIEIKHADGLISRYAHLKRFLSKKNQVVEKGSIIAEVGTSGRSTGPHLHLEVLKNGNRKNPAEFL